MQVRENPFAGIQLPTRRNLTSRLSLYHFPLLSLIFVTHNGSLQDVVRTSILSREWRYKWVTIPNIVFDFQLPFDLQGTLKFKTTVYQVLLLHTGPTVKFTLGISGFSSCPDINHWILFLSKNNVQEFTLTISLGTAHVLPSHLFTFLQLRRLHLSNCVLEPPPTFKGLSRLVGLELVNVTVVPERFAWLISNSPQLEQLECVGITEFDYLEIDCPRLKIFTFCGIFKSICFKHTPLEEISLRCLFRLLNYSHEEGKTSDVIMFSNCQPVIEKLELDGKLLELLGVDNVLKRLPCILGHLKFMDLSSVRFGKIEEISCALCLIRSSPNLQELKILLRKCLHLSLECSRKWTFSSWSFSRFC
ncbi:unnamed protein product [Ilex paraguariensis]|uniref:F-box/LRR-repeat protein 15/At3g58940/PEG3-like LRR domain-containing protein n=1 Tax=Ilex paraguariensis TaxID=185542 RepID=A0ABC8UUD5_9AQUA